MRVRDSAHIASIKDEPRQKSMKCNIDKIPYKTPLKWDFSKEGLLEIFFPMANILLNGDRLSRV